ncbi:MAG: 16S rRNA (guanine(527)-N(7))-methyltransferase RsmG [Treponema sp.]|jgi:16S rRNA (guanine527-N7)-methyltransferase|nr:16S rRNA (guanine(527)-N(7))-methyltransferase RsmG [Treponema sp.]
MLTGGIEALRKKDKEIDRLFTGRTEKITELLNRYIIEIETFNSVYGLVGTKDHDALVVRHILDSIAPAGIISRLLSLAANNRSRPLIADAGSGAGLPGIPLSIILNTCDFTLIERMKRRAGFLWNAKAVLNLSNVTIEENELEKTAEGRFNLITFRAFKPMEPKLLRVLFRACAEGGIIAAYKGKRGKTEREMLPLEKFYKWETIEYQTPFLNEERRLLIIKLLA